ncbi:MAG: hypothetical protein NWQ45_12535, partial [Congregibacter sp.]|nr:hypothetical protein [Congregibacter sp.]
MLIYPRCLCNVAAVLTTAVMAGMLSACIGDLSQAEFPCLVEQDLYNKYNESYVFSPQGEKKR